MLVSQLLAKYKGIWYWVSRFSGDSVVLWKIWNVEKFEVYLKDIEKIENKP